MMPSSARDRVGVVYSMYGTVHINIIHNVVLNGFQSILINCYASSDDVRQFKF